MTLVDRMTEAFVLTEQTERRVIGGRIDTLLMFADEDPTRVHWAEVVAALKAGEWPDTSMVDRAPLDGV